MRVDRRKRTARTSRDHTGHGGTEMDRPPMVIFPGRRARAAGAAAEEPDARGVARREYCAFTPRHEHRRVFEEGRSSDDAARNLAAATRPGPTRITDTMTSTGRCSPGEPPPRHPRQRPTIKHRDPAALHDAAAHDAPQTRSASTSPSRTAHPSPSASREIHSSTVCIDTDAEPLPGKTPTGGNQHSRLEERRSHATIPRVSNSTM